MGLQALLNKYDNGGFTKTGWFQLKDDGDTATVRLLHKGEIGVEEGTQEPKFDFPIYEVHKLDVYKRQGMNNKEVLMIWDINTGYLEPLVKKEDNPESTEAPKAEETEKDGGVKDYGDVYKRQGLSGTPMNKAEDLWNILTWLGVEKRSFYSFRNTYCIMGGYGGYKVVGHKNLESLNAELNKVMIRRKNHLSSLPRFL